MFPFFWKSSPMKPAGYSTNEIEAFLSKHTLTKCKTHFLQSSFCLTLALNSGTSVKVLLYFQVRRNHQASYCIYFQLFRGLTLVSRGWNQQPGKISHKKSGWTCHIEICANKMQTHSVEIPHCKWITQVHPSSKTDWSTRKISQERFWKYQINESQGLKVPQD